MHKRDSIMMNILVFKGKYNLYSYFPLKSPFSQPMKYVPA